MKRHAQGLLVVTLGLCLASPAVAFTGTYDAGTGINRTVHDLGTPNNGGMGYTNPNDTLNRICIFCHAPHNTYRLSPANLGPGASVGSGPMAPDAYDYLPLWNHTVTTQYPYYTMYQNGPGAPGAGAKSAQSLGNMVPGSTSLLCLSCHDGSVAVNSYGNTSQPAASRSNGTALISPSYVIGKDNYLGNHHPVGFDYDAVQAVDIEIRSADSAMLGSAGAVRDHLLGEGNNKMECGTCHSVHNTGNTGESLLWRSDEASRLCLTCHAKGDDPGVTTP